LITLAVKAGSLDKGLQENQETIARVNLKLPDGENVAGPLISAVVDFYDDVSERDEANNIVVSPPCLCRQIDRSTIRNECIDRTKKTAKLEIAQ